MKYLRWSISILLSMFSLVILSSCSNNNNIDFSPTTDELRDFETIDTTQTFLQTPKKDAEEYSFARNSVEAIYEFSVDDIDRDSILENLLYIASRTRTFDSIGEQITTSYIYERLLEYGWTPSFHDFTVYRQSLDTTSHLRSHHSDFFNRPVPKP